MQKATALRPTWPLGGTDWDRRLVSELDNSFEKLTTGQMNIVTKTVAYTVTADDDVILGSGTFTVTLPPVNSCKYRVYYIKNIGTGTITVDGASSETLDDSTTIALANKYDFIVVISDSTEWYIIADMATSRDRDWTGAHTFGDGTNELQVSATGDQTFAGTAGLCFGEIYAADAADTIALAFTGVSDDDKAQITSFDTDGASNNTTPDHTNDHITIVKAGMYLCNVSLHIQSVGTGGADNYGYSVYKNDGGSEFTNLHGQRDLSGGGGDEGSMSLSGIIDLAVDDTVEVWIWNNTNDDDVVIDDINLCLVQIGGT